MKLKDYYKEHGESTHLKRVESALDDKLRFHSDVAERAHVSVKYAKVALRYLAEEGRAEFKRYKMKRPYYGTTHGYKWRAIQD